MAKAFFATRISENISRTPEGFLICTDVVIARTGWQKYKVRDLPQEAAEKFGVDVSRWEDFVELYRPAEEVFAPATLASFEGKPFVVDHPPEFVDTQNSRQFARGHVQNIRRGGALESGEFPILSDVFVDDADAIAAIEGGLREVSCGYSYDLAQQDGKLLQTNIIGNHVALVQRARAGPEARINDGAQGSTEPAVIAPEKFNQKPESRQLSNKEKAPVKNLFAHVKGLGLKALAADAETTPEQLAAAAVAVARASDSEESEEEMERKKKEEKDKRAKDESEEEKRKEKEAADKRTKDAEEMKEKEERDRKAKDAKDAEEAAEKERKEKEAKDAAEKAHFSTCKVKDCMARDCRMHGALDSMLKAYPEAEDADVQQLGELMEEAMKAKKGGAAPQDAAEMGGEIIEPISEEGDGAHDRATDSEAIHARDAEEFAFLKRMKPIVANSGDQAAKADFNARIRRFNNRSGVSGGSYGGFEAGTRTRDQRSSDDKKNNYDDLNAAYAASLKGEKESK